jgi:hypothetical protein
MKRVFRSLLLACVAATLAACGGDDGGAVDPAHGTVRGIVLDAQGQPVAGATVQDQSGASTQTGADGAFTLDTGVGARRLTITKQGVEVLRQCLVVAEQTTQDLGTLTPASPSHCDTVCTNDPKGDDPDCDGLTNDIEKAGWGVSITLADGSVQTRQVTSDPKLKDSDGDGLDDALEFAVHTDPSRPDTDGDGLSDYAEITVYKSNPLMTDTDGDSRGPDGTAAPDPSLSDGFEVLYSRTSPVLADTDGDGKSDWQEIHSGGTNPLKADLPILALQLNGDPNIALDATITSGCSSDSTNLTREAQERVNTDKVSTEMSIKNTVSLHTETEAGTKTWPPSFNAKLTTDTEFKQGYVHETSANFTKTSVQDAQTLAKCWESAGVSYAHGQISVAMKLQNQSDLSLMVKSLHVVAYRVVTGSQFQLVGVLDPVNWSSVVLGPRGQVTMVVKNSDLDAATMKALVNNPAALVFELGSYELFQLDEMGVNETVSFNKLGESVVQQTGLITIDYGDGTVDRHMVATNVYRHPDGSARGVTLKEALASILKLPYETEAQKDADGNVVGKKVLKKVKTTATYQDDPLKRGRGFWVVAGNGDAFSNGIQTDFDDIVLKSGERISLVFLKDTDLDRLFDNEELLLGTDRNSLDTDGDGLSDYEEAKIGWDVVVNGITYHLFPDPRFADVDGDYLIDSVERRYGTDAYKRDTDDDDTDDTDDPYPTSAPSLAPGPLGLAAWWDGSATQDGRAADLWATTSPGDPLAIASPGTLYGTEVLMSSSSWKPPYFPALPATNPVIMLNEEGERVVVDESAADLRRSLSPSAQFTLSAWVYWNGAVTDAPWATVLVKGPWDGEHYGLYIRQDGALAVALTRIVHEKRWNWLGDGACADSDYAIREMVGTFDGATATYVLPKQTWVQVTVTFGDETVRLYADGVLKKQLALNYTWDGGACYSRRDTQYLLRNTHPLTIGVEPGANRWPFRGMLDEVQLFNRQMTANEAALAREIGLRRP